MPTTSKPRSTRSAAATDESTHESTDESTHESKCPTRADQMSKMFALCMVGLAVLILGEKFSGRNAFAIFGGVPDVAVVRDGVIRCQGPFAHPILAGTFAAYGVLAALMARDCNRPLAEKAEALTEDFVPDDVMPIVAQP